MKFVLILQRILPVHRSALLLLQLWILRGSMVVLSLMNASVIFNA